MEVYYLKKVMNYKNIDIMKKLELKKSTVDKYIRYIKDNEELFENKKFEDIIPNTYNLKSLSKSIVYSNLCNEVIDIVDELKKDI